MSITSLAPGSYGDYVTVVGQGVRILNILYNALGASEEYQRVLAQMNTINSEVAKIARKADALPGSVLASEITEVVVRCRSELETLERRVKKFSALKPGISWYPQKLLQSVLWSWSDPEGRQILGDFESIIRTARDRITLAYTAAIQ